MHSCDMCCPVEHVSMDLQSIIFNAKLNTRFWCGNVSTFMAFKFNIWFSYFQTHDSSAFCEALKLAKEKLAPLQRFHTALIIQFQVSTVYILVCKENQSQPQAVVFVMDEKPC